MKVSIIFTLVLSSFFVYGQSGHYGKKNIIHFSPNINFKWAEILGATQYNLDEPEYVTFPLHISYERVMGNSYSLALNFMSNRSPARDIRSTDIFDENAQGLSAKEIYSIEELTVSNTAFYLDYRKYTEGLAPLSSYYTLGVGMVNSRITGDPKFELIIIDNIGQNQYADNMTLSQIIEDFQVQDFSSRNLFLLNLGGGIQYPLNRYLTFGTHFNMAFDSSILSRIFEDARDGFEYNIAEITRMPAYRSFLMRIGFDIAVVF